MRGRDLFELVDGKISRKDSFWKIVDCASSWEGDDLMAPRIGDLRTRPANPDVWDRWDGEQWRFHCWPTARAVSIDLRGVMLHLWVRHCRRRLRWGYTLRVRGRYLLFGGRR